MSLRSLCPLSVRTWPLILSSSSSYVSISISSRFARDVRGCTTVSG